MSNNYFTFKQFTVSQGESAFKVGTDGVLLGACADVAGSGKILDIGTGTGLIALMLAQRCNALITAIEPDHESFTECCENINKSPWKDRVTAIESTLQDFRSDVKYDLIVTNPPYFSGSLVSQDLRKSSARHDISLSSSDILRSLNELLSEDGHLQLILPYAEGNIFIAEAAEHGYYCQDILKIRPLLTSEIRRLILRFGRMRVRPVEKFLTIEYGRRHEFTDEYKRLTGDFYLKF
jgi:tRNA1Val (adenine37-N6)-methyltransferase